MRNESPHTRTSAARAPPINMQEHRQGDLWHVIGPHWRRLESRQFGEVADAVAVVLEGFF